MRVNADLCIGCEVCLPYCSVGALRAGGGVVAVDEESCVECGICLRNAGCPTDAFFWPPEVEQWPRLLRKAFSDPSTPHKSTGIRGRGTEEMKTNDVTGRYRRGELGFALEFGRPGTGTRLGEIEKMTTALVPLGVEFETMNPLADLFDPATGKMREDVKNERVLSAIVEFKVPVSALPAVVATVRGVAPKLDTLFSWDIVTRVEPDGQIPIIAQLEAMGIHPRPNAKINMGLGKPVVES